MCPVNRLARTLLACNTSDFDWQMQPVGVNVPPSYSPAKQGTFDLGSYTSGTPATPVIANDQYDFYVYDSTNDGTGQLQPSDDRPQCLTQKMAARPWSMISWRKSGLM